MILTKVYKYKIKPHSELDYHTLQQTTQTLYRKYAEVDFTYLADLADPLCKTEIIKFYDHDIKKILELIEQDLEIQMHYQFFQNNILDKSVTIEEQNLFCEDYSFSGQVSHIEIYCSDLKKSYQFWCWFLSELGYKEYQKWSQGISFKLGRQYIVLVQTLDKFKNETFHRCHPGLNHLAFLAANPEQINKIKTQAEELGYTILYPDRFPNAGGSNTYALYLEDPEKLKVELVVNLDNSNDKVECSD